MQNLVSPAAAGADFGGDDTNLSDISGAIDGGLLEHLVGTQWSPERWTGTRQALKRVVEALDRLPDRCREVVWLRRVEELPQKDVACRLGISEQTVEKHLAKGMRLIADHLYGGDAVPALDGRGARPVMDQDEAHGRQQTD